MDKDLDHSRLVRIETRLARLQDYLGITTRITAEDIAQSPLNDYNLPLPARLARMETRVFRLLEALKINPRTGKPL